VPTLRKQREEWGTHCVDCLGKFKGWATRQSGSRPSQNARGAPAYHRIARNQKNGPIAGAKFKEAKGGQCQERRCNMPFRQERQFGK